VGLISNKHVFSGGGRRIIDLNHSAACQLACRPRLVLKWAPTAFGGDLIWTRHTVAGMTAASDAGAAQEGRPTGGGSFSRYSLAATGCIYASSPLWSELCQSELVQGWVSNSAFVAYLMWVNHPPGRAYGSFNWKDHLRKSAPVGGRLTTCSPPATGLFIHNSRCTPAVLADRIGRGVPRSIQASGGSLCGLAQWSVNRSFTLGRAHSERVGTQGWG